MDCLNFKIARQVMWISHHQQEMVLSSPDSLGRAA